MTDTLVTFVTDRGFLAPSLLAAQQLVRQKIHEIADIALYTIDVDEKIIRELAGNPANRGIRFEPLAAHSFKPPEGIFLHESHIPVAALARLCLHEVVPAAYENIVYIDGDVQVVGDVSPLVRYRVPDGKLLAGRDFTWMSAADGYNNFISPEYLAGLGVGPEHCFNSGVLAFRRETWRHFAPQALKFFFENSRLCFLYDQSALTAVFKNNVINFQPKYNFHSMYAELYVQYRYPPAIIHFSGPRKPWNYAGPPWGNRFGRSYIDLLREQPVLRDYLKVTQSRDFISAARPWLGEARRLMKMRRILPSRRKRFFDYVRNTRFPF